MFVSLILSYVSFLSVFSVGALDSRLLPIAQNEVSITFDDGPHREYTQKILDILRYKQVPATFFVIGNRILHHEDLLRRELSEGHMIGNHSYSHPLFKKLSLLHIAREFIGTDARIFLATGIIPEYFRFPYGVEDSRIGYFHDGPIIGWSVDAYDWKARNPKTLARNIVRQTKSGSIILLHDIKADTVLALPDIIDGIRAKGYTIVPLKKLLQIPPLSDTRNIIFRNQKNWVRIGGKIESRHIGSTQSIITPSEPKIFTEVGSW